MKVAIIVIRFNHFGGIIGSTAALANGLHKAGIETKIFQLQYSDRTGKRQEDKYPQQTLSGDRFSLTLGFFNNITYKGKENLRKIIDLLSGYDVVLFSNFFTINKYNKGNWDWLELVKSIPSKKYLFIRDANLFKLTPHAILIDEYLDGVIGIDPIGYEETKFFTSPGALIPDIFTFWTETIEPKDWNSRPPSVVKVCMAKRVKKLERYLRAIPFLRKAKPIYIGGRTADFYYIKNGDKSYRWLSDESDVKSEWVGRSYWDVAMEYGLDYKGVQWALPFIANSKALIDCSWYKQSLVYGVGKWNRVILESIALGAIPIADIDYLLGGKRESFVFEPYKNFIPIDINMTPREIAKVIDTTMELDNEAYSFIMKKGRTVLNKYFSERFVVEELLKFIKGEPAGLKYHTGGHPTPKLIDNAEESTKLFDGKKVRIVLPNEPDYIPKVNETIRI